MQVLKKHLQNPSLANENKHFASSSFLLPQDFQILSSNQKTIQPTHFLYLKVPGSQDQLVITYLQMGHIIDIITYNPTIVTFYILTKLDCQLLSWGVDPQIYPFSTHRNKTFLPIDCIYIKFRGYPIVCPFQNSTPKNVLHLFKRKSGVNILPTQSNAWFTKKNPSKLRCVSTLIPPKWVAFNNPLSNRVPSSHL